jgi:hypothetical protein
MFFITHQLQPIHGKLNRLLQKFYLLQAAVAAVWTWAVVVAVVV